MNDVETLLGQRIEALAARLKPRHPVIERVGDQSYLRIPEDGLSLVLPDHAHVGAVQLHAEGHEGYAGFPHRIPCGLAFAMSRDRVRQILGPPEASGEAALVPILGSKPAWDRFSLGATTLHAEYADDLQAVQMFTITTSQAA
ncbi:hypothetical protein [Plastoroseomonas hellenica]|uniref:hypothetical protein n=1 Tax=Plastoroseomonas hellenica TaxID=2687306 RepID=UPI001BA547C3|nr:hypothetical protein [Plastoroseomonas hellenica]MBR0641707.1 hypothetical protein [Plastoroseomonas hellenica]